MLNGGSDDCLTGALLTALSSLARPGLACPTVELEVLDVLCTTEEEGLALTHLLSCCISWKLGQLRLTGQVGQGTWEGLAREADRGTVGSVDVPRNILKRGTVEDVRKVWECSESGIGLGGMAEEMVWKEDGESGWGRIKWLIIN